MYLWFDKCLAPVVCFAAAIGDYHRMRASHAQLPAVSLKHLNSTCITRTEKEQAAASTLLGRP